MQLGAAFKVTATSLIIFFCRLVNPIPPYLLLSLFPSSSYVLKWQIHELLCIIIRTLTMFWNSDVGSVWTFPKQSLVAEGGWCNDEKMIFFPPTIDSILAFALACGSWVVVAVSVNLVWFVLSFSPILHSSPFFPFFFYFGFPDSLVCSMFKKGASVLVWLWVSMYWFDGLLCPWSWFVLERNCRIRSCSEVCF